MEKLVTTNGLQAKNKEIIALVIVSIAVVVGALLFTGKDSKEYIDKYLYRDHALTLGSKDAKVTIVEFFDPACEACRTFYPLVKNQLEQYDGKVNLIVRPVAFHRNVGPVIAALEATKMQGKYWDALYAALYYQSSWTINHTADVALLFPYLQDEGIDIEQLKVDMQHPNIADNMALDAQDAKKLNVLKTPTFYVNGTELKEFGAQAFKALIASEVKKAYPQS